MNFYSSVNHKFLGIEMKIPIPLFLILKKKDIKNISLNNKKIRPLVYLIDYDDINLLLNNTVRHKEKPLKKLMKDINRRTLKNKKKYFNGVLCTIFTLPKLSTMERHAKGAYQNDILKVNTYGKLSSKSREKYLKQKRRKYLKYKISKRKEGD